MAPKIITPKITLKKSIFQARYKPKVNFYDLLVTAAKLFKDEYEHWRTDRLIFEFYDYAKRCSATIAHDRFSCEQDSSDLALANKNTEYMLECLPETLEIPSYVRLGLRRQYLIELPMKFSELVTMLSSKLFSQDSGLLTFMPSSIDDLMYRVDASEDDQKFHITIGPARRAELPGYIQYNKKNHLKPGAEESEYVSIVEKYPDVSIFVDVDFYKDSGEYSEDEARTFVKTADSRLELFIKNLRSFLFKI